jgi:hypothetical protein
MADKRDEVGKIVPLFGRDEMNLVEFPFGPISSTSVKTWEVEHQVWDKQLKREVTRRLIITGADKWGLPRPIDEQVLIGLQMLTYESGYQSQRVEFTRYQLCQRIGWVPDGRSYARIEESLDRMKATTLKFKDAWYDNSEKEHKSRTFSIIDDVEICSRDQIDRARLSDPEAPIQRCSFRWSDVVWKSFQDGFIKTLDMRMYHRIVEGRRREVPLRLYRILDKRFYKKSFARFPLRRLCVGTLGLSPNYGPAQMLRVLDRAAKWLIECEFLESWWHEGTGNHTLVFFRRRAQDRSLTDKSHRTVISREVDLRNVGVIATEDTLKNWIASLTDEELAAIESDALETGFGSDLQRKMVIEERREGIQVRDGGRIRWEYLHRFATCNEAHRLKA